MSRLPEDRAAKLAPEELRRRQLAAMTAWILAAARTQAVVLAFEDLHWADPTSLDLMRALAERGAQAPLLIIATARPEFRPPWSVSSHHSVISLSPLDRVQVAKMVGELSARHALPRDIVEGVSERTGGVPLFVEEVTRLLLERGEQGGAQAIPPTLQQSLAARLDRLGAARETAQIGAVLGRGFSYALLQSVAGLDEGALQSALERLAEADILFVEGDGAQATYRFKHALIQDAAYDSLLKSRRQALHRRAAEILRDSAIARTRGDRPSFHPGRPRRSRDRMVGQGGRPGAAPLGLPGGDRPSRQGDRHGGQGGRDGAAGDRRLGRSEPATDAVARRLRQRAHGGARLWARRKRRKPSQEPASRRPATRTRRNGWRQTTAYGPAATCGASLPSMRAHAAAFLATSRRDPIRPRPASPIAPSGSLTGSPENIADARDHLERALALFQPGRDDDLAFRFGHDAGVAAMCYLAIASWPLGDVERAISLVDGAHERLASVAHIGTHALCEIARGHVRIDARRPGARRAERVRTRPPRA